MYTVDLESKLYRSSDVCYVAGIDEVGVACYAGPIIASAVVLPEYRANWESEVRDSKQVARGKRERLAKAIQEEATWGIGVATSREVDALGPTRARVLAMTRAWSICAKELAPELVGAVVDGANLERYRPIPTPTLYVDKADEKSISVAAASIVAKVARDAYMRALHQIWPWYGWVTNVGYGTRQHEEGIRTHGLTPEHRLRWRPVRKLAGMDDLVVYTGGKDGES